MSFNSCSTLVGATGGLLVLLMPVSASEPPAPPTSIGDDAAESNDILVIEFSDLALPDSAPADSNSVPIPESVRNLNGRRIQIRAFMCPTTKEHGNPAFISVPEVSVESQLGRLRNEPNSNQRCLWYSVPVLLRDGDTIDYTFDRTRNPLIIEGTLKVEGDAMEVEYGPYPFWIEGATYRKVEPRHGCGWLWTIWPC